MKTIPKCENVDLARLGKYYHRMLAVNISNWEGLGFGQNHSTKGQVFDFIRSHPGSHLRQIKRGVNVSMGVVQYHLRTLEVEKKIVSQRRGLYKRFYPNLIFGENQREILNVLSQETERDLLLYLVRNKYASQKELSEYSNISPGTTNWHMKRLRHSGLVSSTRQGQFIRYFITVDKNEILQLLQNYHPNVWETWADRFAEVLDSISYNELTDHGIDGGNTLGA